MDLTSNRRRASVVVTVLATLLFLAGCGSSSSDEGATSAADADKSASDGASSGDDPSDDSSSDLDCAALQDSLAGFTVAPQILVQLKTADQWDLVEEGTIAVDFEEFQASVEGLKPLESLPANGAKVKEALDTYAEAADLAITAQASPDPASSEAGMSLAVLTEDVQGFLYYQATIGIAFDEAECPTS